MVVKEEGNTEDKVSLEFSCAEIELCLNKSSHGRTPAGCVGCRRSTHLTHTCSGLYEESKGNEDGCSWLFRKWG